ncbi:MAG: 50S ribosomal protein L4 [Patescibacteria group bacterium]
MDALLYSKSEKKPLTLAIPDAIFAVRWNADLVHQVLESERANQRVPLARVKTRGEVSGGGKKPWKQKGTGRARHGSTRSPIWVGGGVAHGPTTEKIFARKINKKMARKAITAVLSAKFRDNEIAFLDEAVFNTHKTKQVIEFFKVLMKDFSNIGVRGGRAILVLPERNINAVRAVRNCSFVDAKEARMLQVIDLLAHKFVIIPKDAIPVLEKVLISTKKQLSK